MQHSGRQQREFSQASGCGRLAFMEGRSSTNIVEFLGIPGSGKTTIARLVAARLEQRGYDTRVPLRGAPTLAAHMSAIAHKLIVIQHFLFSAPNEFFKTTSIARLLPQRNFLSTLRVTQYLLYLYGTCHRLERVCDILLLDQGFAQAVYSLALQARAADSAALVAALRATRRPQLVIKLDVPAHDVRFRLGQRRHRQSRLEHMIKLDSQSIEKSIQLINRIEVILQQLAWKVIHHDSSSGRSIAEQVEVLTSKIERAVRN